MTINEVRQFAEEKIQEWIPTHGYTFKFDNAKRRFGQCNYNKKTISISKPLTLANLEFNEFQIKDTILHEIAHARAFILYGRQAANHGRLWKQVCIEIGAKPQVTYSGDDIKRVEGKFLYVCPNCGLEIRYHKRLKLTRACGDCCRKFNNGKFSYDYVLQYKPNYEFAKIVENV